MKRNAYLILPILSVLFLITTTVRSEPVRKEIYYTKNTSLIGTVILRFSLWTADTEAGEEVWFEEKSIRVTGSKIKTYLGDTNPLDGVDFSQQLWIKAERKRKDETYKTIGALERFGIVPYAVWATSPAGPTGPPGPTGPMGPTGPTGEPGTPGVIDKSKIYKVNCGSMVITCNCESSGESVDLALSGYAQCFAGYSLFYAGTYGTGEYPTGYRALCIVEQSSYPPEQIWVYCVRN